MMIGFIPFGFRFRGKTARLGDMYQCFIDNEGKALHPTQISRQTGIGFTEVTRYLEQTPELFVKLPRRPDGITRYRLTTATTAKSPEAVAALLRRNARRESLILWAGMVMLLCLFLIAVVLIGPAL
jgi:hypothetical protein